MFDLGCNVFYFLFFSSEMMHPTSWYSKSVLPSKLDVLHQVMTKTVLPTIKIHWDIMSMAFCLYKACFFLFVNQNIMLDMMLCRHLFEQCIVVAIFACMHNLEMSLLAWL